MPRETKIIRSNLHSTEFASAGPEDEGPGWCCAFCPVNMATRQQQNILPNKHKNILASLQFLDSRIDETAENKYAMRKQNIIFDCTEDKMCFDSF